MLNLREIRGKKKLRQAQIADQAGISKNHYCNIENRKRRPSVPVAKKIARVLDFDWRELYEDDESEQEKSRPA